MFQIRYMLIFLDSISHLNSEKILKENEVNSIAFIL